MLNVILMVVVLSMIVLSRLFDVSISDTRGLSLKNLVIYVAFIGLMLGYLRRLGIVKNLPGIVPISAIFALAAISLLYAPIFSAGVVLDRVGMIASYKNEVFDPYILYLMGFLLTISSRPSLTNIHLVSITFGLINIVALSTFLTGINPFSISVISHDGSRFASYGGLSNQGAYILAFFIPLYYYMRERTDSRLLRRLYLLLIITNILGIALAGSRGGYLLLITELAVLMISTRQYKLFTGIFTMGVVVTIAYSALFGIDFLLSAFGRLGTLVGHKGGDIGIRGATEIDQVSAGRTLIWKGIGQVMLSNPAAFLLGNGWGTYRAHIAAAIGFAPGAHNVFLKVWLQLGVVGLLLLLWSGLRILGFYKRKIVTQDPLLCITAATMLLVTLWAFLLSDPINILLIMAFSGGIVGGYSWSLCAVQANDSKPSLDRNIRMVGKRKKSNGEQQ